MQVDNDLIRKYLSGDCTPQEKAVVEEWLENDASPDTDISLMDNDILIQDLSSVRKRLYEEIPDNKTVARSISIRRKIIYGIAACLAAFLCSSIFYIYYNAGANTDTLTATFKEIYNKGNASQDIRLPDGSKVTLYPGAGVQLPVAKVDKERLVKLIAGKALFDVVHNPELPMKVETGRSVTEVLGTTFTIDRQSASDVVALFSGRISFSVPGKTSYILYPGQQVTYDTASGKMRITVVPVQQKQIEINMQFKDVLLREVLDRLEQKFDVRFHVEDEAIYRLRYTGNLNKQSLKDIEDILSLTADLKFNAQGNTIYVSQ